MILAVERTGLILKLRTTHDMKAKSSGLLVSAIVIGILVGMSMLPLARKYMASPPLLVLKNSTNQWMTATLPGSKPGNYLKVITDTNTGEYACVSDDATTVILNSVAGKTIWSVNVAQHFQNGWLFGEKKIQTLQFISNGKVWNQPVTNQLILYFGKYLVGIDCKTGRYEEYGSD